MKYYEATLTFSVEDDEDFERVQDALESAMCDIDEEGHECGRDWVIGFIESKE